MLSQSDLAATHLATLGLQPGASRADVRSAYRHLARAWHPDRHHGADERLRAKALETFKKVASSPKCVGDLQGLKG